MCVLLCVCMCVCVCKHQLCCTEGSGHTVHLSSLSHRPRWRLLRCYLVCCYVGLCVVEAVGARAAHAPVPAPNVRAAVLYVVKAVNACGQI
jgi:hypothetical protein